MQRHRRLYSNESVKDNKSVPSIHTSVRHNVRREMSRTIQTPYSFGSLDVVLQHKQQQGIMLQVNYHEIVGVSLSSLSSASSSTTAPTVSW